MARAPVPALALSALLLSTGPAAAASFDCAQARSADERLICSVPALDAADTAVGAAYKTLMGTLATDETARSFARTEQRAWTERRNRACGFGPGAVAGVTDPGVCLLAELTRRSRQLVALRANPALGARLRTVPVTKGQPGTRLFIQAEQPDIADPAYPGAAAFNETIRRFVAGEIQTFRTDAADLPKEMESELILTADAYLPAPGIVSVQFVAEGVQGNGFRYAAAVTVDVAQGLPLTPAQMFGDSPWLATATAACRTAVGPDPGMAEVCTGPDLQNPRTWRFEPDRAVATLLLPGKELREIAVPFRPHL